MMLILISKNLLKMSELKQYKMFIDGEWVDSESKKTYFYSSTLVSLCRNSSRTTTVEKSKESTFALRLRI